MSLLDCGQPQWTCLSVVVYFSPLWTGRLTLPHATWYWVLMGESMSKDKPTSKVSDRSEEYDASLRPRGRPPTKKWPEPLDVDPDELVQSLFNGPPKKDWRYQKESD